MARITLKHINRFLAGLLICLGLYLVILPLISESSYRLKKAPTPEKYLAESENRVIIKSSKINAKVVEGQDISVINNGNVWRRPASSVNPEKSNMVIVGHNFTYTDPITPFYSLNRTKVGDQIDLLWQKKRYNYVVTERKIVKPTDTYIEAPTKTPTLTLYTCYPMFSDAQRIVIRGELKQ